MRTLLFPACAPLNLVASLSLVSCSRLSMSFTNLIDSEMSDSKSTNVPGYTNSGVMERMGPGHRYRKLSFVDCSAMKYDVSAR